MSAQVRGFTTSSLIPGPSLTLSRDAEGKTTVTRDFSALQGALANPIIQSRVAKGTAITSLCSDIPADFQHLEVDSFESRDNPGGITTISITFTGYSEDGEFSFDREVTYSLRGVIVKRPIHLHPNFIAQIDALTSRAELVRNALSGIVLGTHFALGDEPSNYEVRSVANQQALIETGIWPDEEDANAWWDLIVKKGWREYDSPAMEWTRSATNAGGLGNTDIATLGKKDDPPGSPPTPDGITGWWQMADLGDERSSNQSSNSLTWRFVEGEVEARIYDY